MRALRVLVPATVCILNMLFWHDRPMMVHGRKAGFVIAGKRVVIGIDIADEFAATLLIPFSPASPNTAFDALDYMDDNGLTFQRTKALIQPVLARAAMGEYVDVDHSIILISPYGMSANGLPM